MNRKRDKIARSQKIQEKQRVKRNVSRRKNAQFSVEKLNHRRNVIEAKNIELANKYIEELTRQFNIRRGK